MTRDRRTTTTGQRTTTRQTRVRQTYLRWRFDFEDFQNMRRILPTSKIFFNRLEKRKTEERGKRENFWGNKSMGIHSFAVLREKKHKQRPSTRNEGSAMFCARVFTWKSWFICFLLGTRTPLGSRRLSERVRESENSLWSNSSLAEPRLALRRPYLYIINKICY